MSNFPYPGLRPFNREEGDIFCGRTQSITELVNKINDSHFIAVVGDSGCGKSSLVRAGLLPRLKIVPLEGREHWRTATMRPGNAPFLKMAHALLKDTGDDEKQALRIEYLSHYRVEPNDAVEHLKKTLAGNLETSYKKLEKILPDNHNLLIVVDQFEELFRYSPEDQVEEFVKWLLTSCQHPDSRIYVVITMRSEFLDEYCAQYEELVTAINHGYYQTPHLSEKQLEEAIEFPPKLYDGEVEPELVRLLLAQISNLGRDCRPDHLPLLQHALARMWSKVQTSESKKLTVQHYKEIGGNLAAALTQEADKTYFAVKDDSKRQIIEILFRRLSQRVGKNDYTRHPVELKEVADLANVISQTVSDIADTFRQAEHDFLFAQNKSSKGYLQTYSVIDIRHESIIRQWERLKHWANEEAEWADFYWRWERATQRWQTGTGELWRGLDLETALDWVKKIQHVYPKFEQLKLWANRYGRNFDLAWQFLEESKKAKEEEQRLAEEAKKREVAQQIELEKRQNDLESFQEKLKLSQENLKLSQEKLLLSRQRTRIALASVLVVAIIAGWGFWERRQAQHSEQTRTESLFESYRRHAALLVQEENEENYALAQQTLEQTYELDPKISASSRHARDLLARFIDITSGNSQQDYHGAKAVLYAVALSPDQQQLVAVGEKGTVVLFEVKTGTLLQRFVGHDTDKHVRAVAFEPQGQWFATAGDDEQIFRWSMSKEQPIKTWRTDAEVWALAVDSTGHFLASGGSDKLVTIWHIETDQPQYTLSGHDDIITGLAFSPKGELLASTSYDDTVRLWQLSDGQMRHQLKAHTDNVQEIVFSPDGQLLATCSDDETIRLWEVETGKSTASLQGHQDKVFGITFTEDGRYLASSSADMTIRLWDVASGVTLRIFQGHSASVTGLTTAGQNIFSSSADGTIKRWSTELPYQFALDLPSPPTATAIAPDGKSVAVGFENGLLQGYSLSQRQQIWEPEKTVHTRDLQRLAFSPNSQWLATASLDNTAIVWQIQGNQLIYQATIQHQAGVNAVAFSPDGQSLLTASYDGQMGWFKLDTQAIQFYPLYQTDMNSVVWDASGSYLLTANDNLTYLWNWHDLQLSAKPKPMGTYPPTQETTWWAALSPNAQQVATVGRYFRINVYPSVNGAEPYYLSGHKDTVIRAIFSPDSQQLATMGGDNTVRVWDLLQKSELFTLNLPIKGKNVVWDFDFRCTPKGCWIAVPLTSNQKLMLYELGNIYD